jgi:hypothetical protein
MCPECLSDNVETWEYDYGVCPQTGYHDAGERFKCHDCGATGDADDLVLREGEDSSEPSKERAPEEMSEPCTSWSVGSLPAAGGGG